MYEVFYDHGPKFCCCFSTINAMLSDFKKKKILYTSFICVSVKIHIVQNEVLQLLFFFFISGADKARLMNSYQRIKVVMLLAFIPLCGLGLSFSVTKAGGGTSSSSSSLPPPPPPSHLI